MGFVRSLGWSAVLCLFMGCLTIAAEKPGGVGRDPRPGVKPRPTAVRPGHLHGAGDEAPPATAAAATSPAATAPVEALPVTGPSGDGAVAALRNLGPVQDGSKRDWLLLVYICGENNLEADALLNLKQMEIGMPDSGVEVLVLFDRADCRQDDGSVTHPILYRVRKSKGPDHFDSEVLKDLGVIDMADPKILSAFIEGAVKTYPAQHYSLCAWDHGGGWSGLLYDDGAPGKTDHQGNKDRDNMDLPTFRAGVVDGMKAAGLAKWDMLTFDMCLMAQLEVAAEIHDLADIMIASEETEPGTGFPHVRVLQLLGKGTLGGRRIGAEIVQEYEKLHTADGERSTTLSAFDLSLFDDVNSKFNALADKLLPVMPTNWSKLSKSLYYAEQFGDSTGENGRTNFQSVDLLDALKKCRSATPDFPAEAEFKALVQAMDRFVIASATSRRRQMSNGLAIYAPLTKEGYNAEYEKTQFFKISRWPALLQSIFAGQAKNTEPAKFGKIQMVDSLERPILAMMPLTGCGISIEVEGKDLIWVRALPSMHDGDLGGSRVYSINYVVDQNLGKKLNQGLDKFGQDIDAIMPQMIDGRNNLRKPTAGVMVGLSNGQTKVEAMIDCSNLADPANFTIPVLIYHPSYGAKPRKATLRADFKNFAVTSVLLLPEAENSSEPGTEITPPADAVIIPQFWLIKDADGTSVMASKGSLKWNSGLGLTISLLPAGDYEDYFTARTMTGVEAFANYKYKVGSNEIAEHAPQTWNTFQSEMMVGTWQVKYSPIPGQEFDTKITANIQSTDDPLTYRAAVTSIDAEGKATTANANLIFEIQGQPLYRMIFDPVGTNDSMVLIGLMLWAPRDGRGCLFTHALGFEQDYVWLQKGAGPGPGPIPRNKPLPAGWNTIGDARETLSLVIPPTFVANDQMIQDGKKIFDGYDHASVDPNLNAAIEIIRFDGMSDAAQVVTALVAGYKKKGIELTLSDITTAQIDGVFAVFASAAGSKGADDKNPFAGGLYLIPTPRGIVVACFSCSSDKFEELVPMMWKLLGTARVAK